MSLLGRLQTGLARTREGLLSRLDSLIHPGEIRRIGEVLDELEEILIQADVGPAVAAELVSAIRTTSGRDRGVASVADLKGLLAAAIASLEAPKPASPGPSSPPRTRD